MPHLVSSILLNASWCYTFSLLFSKQVSINKPLLPIILWHMLVLPDPICKSLNYPKLSCSFVRHILDSDCGRVHQKFTLYSFICKFRSTTGFETQFHYQYARPGDINLFIEIFCRITYLKSLQLILLSCSLGILPKPSLSDGLLQSVYISKVCLSFLKFQAL